MALSAFRKTTQDLAPAHHTPTASGQYDIYPGFQIPDDQIWLGYDALAMQLTGHAHVIIDGDVGVLWDNFRERLDCALLRIGIKAMWQDVSTALLQEIEINNLIAPFLGGDDPIFGTRFTGSLGDFFSASTLSNLCPDPAARMTILYGCGAALAGWDGLLVYVDVPKNEIQFRSRAGAVRNLGAPNAADPKVMYKRFYFVDWVAVNRHRAQIVNKIDVMVDEQRPDAPTVMRGDTFRAALKQMGQNYLRARPWFEPGPWGGQWIRKHIPQLSQSAPNYAWSFELISPENGIAFESSGLLLEVSFDWLMFYDNKAILGRYADRFGYEFPVRFDFLDTFDGGNLSVQCHPRPEYARKHFGETFTQDETYYILDCAPGAEVYLGFRENIDPDEFRTALERSFQTATPLDVERYVTKVPARRHDLFLIPNGTIHCSGVNNLVLEISATPYIFTFKMYDWLRLDLDGRPRPLNIARAFENLYFERKGDRVDAELVSKQGQISQGEGWTLIHVPTHHEHFYDVHRYEMAVGGGVSVQTEESPHVLSLVEGRTVTLETAGGLRWRFSFAETFVIPAAAGSYRLINDSGAPIKVVKCFMKPEAAC